MLNNSTLVSADTREAVMKAVSELDYLPNANARALATQVSDTIGVVVMDVSDAFFGALVKAVDLVAQQHQKYVLIGNSYHEAEKERHAIEVLIRQRCNALIVHSKALSDDELAQFMDNIHRYGVNQPRCAGTPIVAFARIISAVPEWRRACC